METRILLGCRETPSFVTQEFYAAMMALSSVQSFDAMNHTDVITYHIPRAFVARKEDMDYTIRLDDVDRVPYCRVVKTLQKWRYRYKRARRGFDRYTVFHEYADDEYFALLPHARYDDVWIYRNQQSFMLLHHDIQWLIIYREVFVDPHTTDQSIWFASTPKYQIEIRCRRDFREEQTRLQLLLQTFIPSSFR